MCLKTDIHNEDLTLFEIEAKVKSKLVGTNQDEQI